MLQVNDFQDWQRRFDNARVFAGQVSPDDFGIMEMTVKLTEELGEVAQCILKLEGKARSTDTVEHLDEEVADMIVVLTKIMNWYGRDLESALRLVQEKLSKRWQVDVDRG